jgi:DNA-3-methyladenine glycosylase II
VVRELGERGRRADRRRDRRRADVAPLAVPQPYDFALSTERFRVFGVDRATVWHEGGLHRVVGGREVRIEVAEGGVDVEPFDEGVRELLGFPFELEPFYEWAQRDEVLRDVVVRLRGFRPPLLPDPWEMLVGSITAQQVSLFSATAIRNRLIERYGTRHVEAWAFPTREAVAAANEGDLLALGFSRRKEEYVLGLARSDLDLDALRGLPDDEVRARLVALRGLGEWTAEWFLARHLARPNAWPWGDLALRKAVAELYGGLDVREARERFRPFENLTAHYLLLAQRVP